MLDGEHLVAVDGRQVRPEYVVHDDSDQTAPLGMGSKGCGSLLTLPVLEGVDKTSDSG